MLLNARRTCFSPEKHVKHNDTRVENQCSRVTIKLWAKTYNPLITVTFYYRVVELAFPPKVIRQFIKWQEVLMAWFSV